MYQGTLFTRGLCISSQLKFMLSFFEINPPTQQADHLVGDAGQHVSQQRNPTRREVLSWGARTPLRRDAESAHLWC